MPVVPGAIVAGDTERFGTEKMNALLAAVRAALWNPLPAGGSPDVPHPGTAYQRIHGAVPFKVPAAEQAPGVWALHAYLICEDAAVTITPRVRQISGTPADIVTGTACSGTASNYSGTGQDQTLPFTPTPGVIYEAWAAKSADTKDGFIVAVWERTDS